MAKAKYESLPPSVREILDENSGEAEGKRIGRVNDSLKDTVVRQLASKPNQKVVKLTPELEAKWKALAQPLIAAWENTDDAHRKVVEAARRFAPNSDRTVMSERDILAPAAASDGKGIVDHG